MFQGMKVNQIQIQVVFQTSTYQHELHELGLIYVDLWTKDQIAKRIGFNMPK